MSDERDEPLERIEKARSDAAAMVIQSATGDRDALADTEDRLADAVHEAADVPMTEERRREELADEAEGARDEMRERLFGEGAGGSDDDEGPTAA